METPRLPPPECVHFASDSGPLILVTTSVQGAAEYLAKNAAIRTSTQWTAWLYNNAKPSRRVNYRVPFTKRLNRTSYAFANLDRVARIEMYLANKLPTISPEDQQWIDAHPDTTSKD